MKICLIGSLPPYKDGIADHNYYLFKNLLNNKDEFYILPSLNENLEFPEELKRYISTNIDVIKSKNPDIYHLQFGNSYPNSYVFRSFNLVKNTDSKIIVTLHDTTNTNIAKVIRTVRSDPKKLLYELDKPSFEEIIKRADSIIVYSDFIKKFLQQKYNVSRKIFVSYIGANTELKTNDNKPNKTDSRIFKICSYGSVTPRKGNETVIEALNILKQKNIHFQYYILGSFNFIHYKIYLKLLIKKLELGDNIKLLGFRPMNEVDKLLQTSDIIIQPRRYSNEGASASLATALLSSKPVITTDIGSLSEYIIPNETGLLVKHTAIDYANAIEKLYLDKKLRKSLGKNAVKWALENLSWEHVADIQYKMYKTILKNK